MRQKIRLHFSVWLLYTCSIISFASDVTYDGKITEPGTRDQCASADDADACAKTDRNEDGSHFKAKYLHQKRTDEVVLQEIETEEEFIDFEFPKLTRVDPGQVGDVVEVELEDGKLYKRITRAVDPPIFEIPNYLSDREIDHIISAASNLGMEVSEVVGEDTESIVKESDDLKKVNRVSEQSWITDGVLPDDIQNSLRARLKNLLKASDELLEFSEPLQVVRYTKGGHYHAHLDSSDTKVSGHLPCCIQTLECRNISFSSPQIVDCCRVCRYATVLFYLTDVEKGGETAFPLANLSDEELEEKIDGYGATEGRWDNLSFYCYNASVIIKPKRGTAIMWYNHHLDKDGYLGPTDPRSYHGGCDVIKGKKWIANNWISGATFRDRNKYP